MGNSTTDPGYWEELAVRARFRVANFALLAGRSTRQFNRDFHRLFGCSPLEYLTSLRLRRSQTALRAGAPVKEAASAAGLNHASSFCRWFKRAANLTPGEFAAADSAPEQGSAEDWSI